MLLSIRAIPAGHSEELVAEVCRAFTDSGFREVECDAGSCSVDIGADALREVYAALATTRAIREREVECFLDGAPLRLSDFKWFSGSVSFTPQDILRHARAAQEADRDGFLATFGWKVARELQGTPDTSTVPTSQAEQIIRSMGSDERNRIGAAAAKIMR